MKKTVLFLTAIFLIASLFSQNEKRLALVIGNAKYVHGGSLKNPVNDAVLMYRTLQDLGFEVTLLTNAELKDMQKSAIEFTNKVNDYDVALFYYAGHGVQVNGINFLVPVDAKMDDELAAKYEAFDISDINYAFSRNSDNLNIMILDACRDNPFRSWMRSGNSGFVAPGNQAAGTIIAFATREGETASDGSGDNGLFTEKLVEQLLIPQNITEVFQNTRVEVLKESGNRQCPQEWNMLTGNFSLAEGENLVISTNTDEESTGGLVIGEVEKAYGTILIDTEIGGKLFFNGKLMGNLPANSKGNKLTKTNIGNHTLMLEGTDGKSYTKNIYLKKDQTYHVTFEIEQTNDLVADDRSKKYKAGESFVDSRDGKRYGTVKIGNQIWMAENLAFESDEGSWSYSDSKEFASKFGYLYDYRTAQNVCPDGWHLPSKEEWETLKTYIEENASPDKKRKEVKDQPAKPLKSKKEWLGDDGNGIDEYSFALLPAGYRRANGTYSGKNKVSPLWTSTDDKKDKAIAVEFKISHDFAIFNHYETYGFAVRCVKD
jgi:uncharacterized protein (TIGR02145 family)